MVVMMVGNPVDHLPLGRCRAKNEEKHPKPRVSLVARMRALTVIAKRDSESAHLSANHREKKCSQNELSTRNPTVRGMDKEVNDGNGYRGNRQEDDHVGQQEMEERLFAVWRNCELGSGQLNLPNSYSYASAAIAVPLTRSTMSRKRHFTFYYRPPRPERLMPFTKYLWAKKNRTIIGRICKSAAAIIRFKSTPNWS